MAPTLLPLVDADALADISVIQGSTSGKIITSEATLDLTGKTVQTITVESSNATGTTFTVDNKTTAFQVRGGPGADTLQTSSFAFTPLEREAIFNTSLIDVIIDTDGIFGNNEANILQADPAGSVIFAGGGDDELISDIGDDTFTGGGGDDTHKFVLNSGNDIITDFVPGAGTDDVLDFTALGISFADLTIAPTNGGADTLITTPNGDTILLQGVAPAALDANADFLFATGGNTPPTVTVTDPAAVAETDDPTPVTVTIADQVAISDPDAGDVPVPYEANSLGLGTTTGPTPPAGTLGDLFTLDASAGTITYDRQALNYLAAGEQVTATFDFTSGSGPDTGLAQQIILTIDGENDAPTVTVTDPAAVLESDGPAIETVTITDQVAIADPDSSDVAVAYEASSLGFGSATGPTPPAGTLGDLFTLDDAAGTISYDRQAFNYLAVGEQVLATFNFTSASGPDTGLAQQITLTINGENDAPTVTVTDPTVVTESDNSAVEIVTIADQVAISDADSSDAATPYEASSLALASATGPNPPAGVLGDLFTLDAVAGTISYDRQAFNYLAVGEQVLATFDFTSASGPDAGLAQQITVAIDGENDAPTAVDDTIAAGTGFAGKSQFLVNETTNLAQTAPSLAALAGGGFVAAWTDASGADEDVRARIFDSEGIEIVTEFVVNTTTASDQSNANVAALEGGGFVVSWTDGSGADQDVRARVFDATGTETVAEFVVNTTTASNQVDPGIAALTGGGFVVTWADTSGADQDVRARVFDANGTELVAEFVVNTTTASGQFDPSAAALSGGGFAIAWTDSSGADQDVRVRVFDATGAEVVAEFVANTTTTAFQGGPSIVGLDNGNFVVTWTDLSGTAPDASGTAVRGQIYDASGVPVGAGEFLVNTNTNAGQGDPSVSALPGGGFVVSWTDNSGATPDLLGSSVRAQAFDALGVPVGSEIPVNTVRNGDQFGASVTVLDNGDFVVGWEDTSGAAPDGSGSSVRARIFTPAGETVDQLQNGNVLTNDFDVDLSDTLTVVALNGEAGDVGTQVTLASGALLTLNADGTFNYDPNGAFEALAEGEARIESFDYTISDNNGETDTAAASITVVGLNNAPTVTNVSTGAIEDGPVISGSFAGADVDSDDDQSTLVYAITAQPAEGSASVNAGDPTMFDFDPGSDFQDLAAGEERIVTFDYIATDSRGAVSNTGTITVTVTGTNDAPTVTVTNPAAVLESDDSAIETVTIADQVVIADPDSTDVAVPYEASSLGFASASGPTPPAGTLGDLFTLDATAGTISYDRGGFNFLAAGEQVLASFDFTSASGPDASLAQQITLTINGENDAPTVTVTDPAAVLESDGSAVETVTIADQVAISDPDGSDVATPYEANSLGHGVGHGPDASGGDARRSLHAGRHGRHDQLRPGGLQLPRRRRTGACDV